MKTLITQSMLDDARAQHTRAEFWDSRLTNFFVQVRASGRAFFYIRYRPSGCSKYRSFHFSSADVLTVKQARDHARHLLAAIALGDDPAQSRDAEKHGLLLRDIVASHYLPHIKATKKSWQTDEILLRCHVLPVLGDRPLVAISKADLAALLIRLRSESHLAPATCNRTVVILRYLYNLCLNLWQIPGVSDNPASHLPLLPVHNHRQTFLGAEGIKGVRVIKSAKQAGVPTR